MVEAEELGLLHGRVRQPGGDFGNGGDPPGADQLFVDDQSRCGKDGIFLDLFVIGDLFKLGFQAKIGNCLVSDIIYLLAVLASRAKDFDD